MKIELTYTEIMEYLRKHVGRDVLLSDVSEKTVRVVTEVEYRILFRHTLDVDVNISLDKIVGSDLFLSYMFPSAKMDTIAKKTLPLFRTKISEKLPMIEMLKDNNLIVHLSKISQMQDTLKKVELVELKFNLENTIVRVRLK